MVYLLQNDSKQKCCDENNGEHPSGRGVRRPPVKPNLVRLQRQRRQRQVKRGSVRHTNNWILGTKKSFLGESRYSGVSEAL